MPQRFWKGYLKLSLVTCAVSLLPATSENSKIRFHVLNRATRNRVESHYIDSVTGKAVAEEDEVKGYPRGENDYVLLEDDEIDAVALESTRTIDIDTFVANDSIDWIWYDKPHFLIAEDKVGMEAFCVIRDAMAASKVVGIARLVLYRRERAVLLEPAGRGIILWTLRYGDEVRTPDKALETKEKPDAESLSLMKKLVQRRTEKWSPALTEDPVENRLADIVEAKKQGRKKKPEPAKKPTAPTGGNVIDIMDALRKSVASQERRSK
ncbi:Ku protein [Rhizobium tubonense]|uniref:Non-homologous end joining protein Ku n=1 Tax=Rhizobium tubonense TaxID=484088 RepID=A0A2W4CFN7_9HYPH|nr:Ku protein [Rhizobium tubonense]PZM11561.1 Ku protein [Rhizobium tubonense]